MRILSQVMASVSAVFSRSASVVHPLSLGLQFIRYAEGLIPHAELTKTVLHCSVQIFSFYHVKLNLHENDL